MNIENRFVFTLPDCVRCIDLPAPGSLADGREPALDRYPNRYARSTHFHHCRPCRHHPVLHLPFSDRSGAGLNWGVHPIELACTNNSFYIPTFTIQ